MVVACGLLLMEKKQSKTMSLMSTGLFGAPWQLFCLQYFEFPSMFSSPCFLIGYTSCLTGYKLVCTQETPHMLGYQAKTIQLDEYPQFLIGQT